MNIAIDESPLLDKQHKVRGSGYYLQGLKDALLKNFTDNAFVFYKKGDKLPKNTDVLHVPYFEPFFRTLPFFNPFNSVVTIHDLTPLIYPDLFPVGAKGKIMLSIQKVLLKRYKAVITDSEASANDIAIILGTKKHKIHVVPLAASDHFKKLQMSLKEKNTQTKKFNLPQKFALYVGDATRNKNLPRLVQAATIAGIPLVMVGSTLANPVLDKQNPWNADLVEVQTIARKNKRVIILGFVPDADLVALYNMATMSVSVSLYEGFGLPALEAMQCGSPLIVSKLGSLPEVVGSAGYYVDAFDVHDIARGMQKVFDDSRLRRKLSEKGIAQAKKFTWSRTASETMHVYEKVAHT